MCVVVVVVDVFSQHFSLATGSFLDRPVHKVCPTGP